MAATREDIEGWLLKAMRDGCTHLIVACDTFEHEDYPIYVAPGEDAREMAAQAADGPMTRVMEVYKLALPLGDQLREHRARHF